MAIADRLNKLRTDISSAYSVVETKGGTIPVDKNTNNLASAIESISGGSLQTKSITITENGTTNVTADSGYDALNKVNITTNVGGGGYDDYLYDTPPEYSNNVQKIIKKLPVIDLSNTQSTTFSFNGCQYLTEIEGIINTSGLTSMNSMFNGCIRLLQIPSFNTSNVNDMRYCFMDCINIETIPQFDTSKVTTMANMFSTSLGEGQHGGSALITVPILNTSRVTNFQNIFYNRNYLSDTSLDNILQMCIGATSYTGTKTLRQLGIYNATYYPTSRIQALPHYQDFVDAGWTLGY